MIDLSPATRYTRIKNLTDAWMLMTSCPKPASSDDYSTWRHATSYIFNQREFYLKNAYCEHCGKYIIDRGDGFTHEDGEEYCEVNEQVFGVDAVFYATPAYVIKTRIQEAA